MNGYGSERTSSYVGKAKDMSNTTPRVSIVLANFNGGDWLQKSISSVLAQKYQNWELILIDDCSTDHSREIIESFQDNRIYPFYLPNNQHMVYGFNFGISQARGEYIARIDSDDFWHSEKLALQVEFLDCHPEYGACFTWVDVVDENDNQITEFYTDRVEIFKVKNMGQAKWLHYMYFRGACLCHPSVLMRKTVLDDVGWYNYALVQIQDYELWLRIVKKYPIYVIQTPLVNYRWFMNGENASAPSPTTNIRSNYEFTYVLSKFFDDIPDDLFIKAFQSEFIHKDRMDKLHLECEKMFLQLRAVFCGHAPKLGGMERFAHLLEAEETREILKKDYGVNQKNFYELSASPLFYDPSSNIDSIPLRTLIRKVIIRILDKTPALKRFLKGCMRLIGK